MIAAQRRLVLVREFTAHYQVGSDLNLNHANRTARSLQIHTRALARAESYRIAESDLIHSLREIDDDKTFEMFDCTNLYGYAIKKLKLSEDVACNLIAIMRKSRKVPELADAIREGVITASMARKIVPVINESNKAHWLELATTSTYKAVEKAVATENPKLAVTESIIYKTGDRLELKLGVSEDWIAKLTLVKDLISQKEARAVSTEEALLAALEMFIYRSDPVEKAKRADQRKNQNQTASRTARSSRIARVGTCDIPRENNLATHTANFGSMAEKNRSLGEASDAVSELSVARRIDYGGKRVLKKSKIRRPLTACTKNFVHLRDQRRCTEKLSDGSRCEERRWLHFHHIVPISEGGSDEWENLTTLCSKHHAQRHAH